MICTLFIHGHKFTFKHLCWHSITKILRNGPRAHFPFSGPVRGRSPSAVRAVTRTRLPILGAREEGVPRATIVGSGGGGARRAAGAGRGAGGRRRTWALGKGGDGAGGPRRWRWTAALRATAAVAVAIGWVGERAGGGGQEE
jgi:hypothetical protein